jgi:hypothetical protein
VIANIIEHFSTLKTPHRDHPNRFHKLIVITLCAILAKPETWGEIADRAEEKIDFFLLTSQHLAGCSRYQLVKSSSLKIQSKASSSSSSTPSPKVLV